MIPPCDPSILNNNPQFRSLHNHLTTAILDSDGCERAVENHPSRKKVRDELKACQIRHAKTQVLKRVVGSVACDSERNGLPDELQDLVAVIALYLHHEFEEEDVSSKKDNEDFLSLFRPDLEAFRANIRVIAPAVAAVLRSDVSRLRALVDVVGGSGGGDSSNAGAGTGGRPQSTRISHRRQQSRSAAVAAQPVSELLGSRLHALRTTQMETLPEARRKMTTTGAEVLAAHAEVMERTIQVLERTKHGALARAGKARAEHLAKVAEGMEGKVRIVKHETLSTIYTVDTISALTHYREHLHDTRLRLEEKQKEAMTELQAYELADSGKEDDDDESGLRGGGRTARERNRNMGSGAGGVMVEIARRYGTLVKEVEGVRMEIKRLGGE